MAEAYSSNETTYRLFNSVYGLHGDTYGSDEGCNNLTPEVP